MNNYVDDKLEMTPRRNKLNEGKEKDRKVVCRSMQADDNAQFYK